MAKVSEREQYRQQYPATEKWLHQCLICQTTGYKPEMPKQISIGVLAQNIQKLYSELKLNGLGLCYDCAQHYKK